MTTTEQFTQYTPTPALNNMAVPVGWPTGMNPSDVEPTAREMLAVICNTGLQSGAYLFTDTGSLNALRITTGVPGNVTLAVGQTYRVQVLNTNTIVAPTLTVDGNAAKPIVFSDNTALLANSLLANAIYTLTYDGTSFRLPFSASAILGTSSFASAVAAQFTSSLNSPGYEISPSGKITQWGTTSPFASGATGAVSFPLVFPTACLSVVACLNAGGGASNAAATVYSFNPSYFNAVNNANVAAGISWQAVGH